MAVASGDRTCEKSGRILPVRNPGIRPGWMMVVGTKKARPPVRADGPWGSVFCTVFCWVLVVLLDGFDVFDLFFPDIDFLVVPVEADPDVLLSFVDAEDGAGSPPAV